MIFAPILKEKRLIWPLILRESADRSHIISGQIESVGIWSFTRHCRAKASDPNLVCYPNTSVGWEVQTTLPYFVAFSKSLFTEILRPKRKELKNHNISLLVCQPFNCCKGSQERRSTANEYYVAGKLVVVMQLIFQQIYCSYRLPKYNY